MKSKLICKNCQKEFYSYIYSYRPRTYCSHSCAMQQQKHTESRKKHMSELFTGSGNPAFGIPASIERRMKVSLSCMGINQGSDNGNWKNGITPINIKIRQSIEYRLWREAVFARDNWTCQDCGDRGAELEAHHIKKFADYPELRFAIDNGQTLCILCHNKTKTKDYARENSCRVKFDNSQHFTPIHQAPDKCVHTSNASELQPIGGQHT